MKGHFYLRMEQLLQPAGTFGITVISFMAFREHFKKKLNMHEYFRRGAGSSYFESDI